MQAMLGVLIKLAGMLPFAARRFLGARLGDAARLLGVRRRVAMRNLMLAFPEMPEKALRKTLRRHFQLLGAVFMDECAFRSASAETLCSRARPEPGGVPEEAWIPADAKSAPVIFCVPHFVAAGLGGLRLSCVWGGRLAFHYRPLHSPFWDRFYGDLRGRHGARGIAATSPGAMRRCVRHLQEGGALFYLPDTDAGRRKSMVFAPFLGVRHAATNTALSRLAAITGAQVRMLAATCTADGYAVHVSPPLAGFPGAAAEDARRVNEWIGGFVRRDPAQYYWLHRRFKTRPRSEEEAYD